MKILIISIFLLITPYFYAQNTGRIGINTVSPKTTMEIKIIDSNESESSTTNEGLIIPRISRQRAKNMTYATPYPETSTLVYIDNLTGAPNGSVVNVTEVGFYFWNGSQWENLSDTSNNTAWNTSGNTITSSNFLGSLNNEDLVFKRNNEVIGSLKENSLSLGLNGIPITSTGQNNYAFGNNLLDGNIGGGSNVTFGNNLLKFSRTYKQSNNIIFGNNIALVDNPDDDWNSSSVIFSGMGTLKNSVKGGFNVVFGKDIMTNNQGAATNVAIGDYTQHSITTGSTNTAIGESALFKNEEGRYNVAIGKNAAYNYTSVNSVVLGINALYENRPTNSGFRNPVAIGKDALKNGTNITSGIAIGNSALLDAQQDYSVGIGKLALSNSSTPRSSVGIGNNVQVPSSNANRSIMNIGDAIYGFNYFSPIHNHISINTSTEHESTLTIDGSMAFKIDNVTSSNSITNDAPYHTLLIVGNISLPTASTENKGRIYYLINDSPTATSTISATFREAGANVNNITLNVGDGITVQSNGSTAWVIIDKL